MEDEKIINLKCIDDFNNKIGLILKENINGIFKLLNVDYMIDIPTSNIFSNENNKTNKTNKNNITNENNIINEDNIIYDNNTIKYSKSMLYDPFE